MGLLDTLVLVIVLAVLAGAMAFLYIEHRRRTDELAAKSAALEGSVRSLDQTVSKRMDAAQSALKTAVGGVEKRIVSSQAQLATSIASVDTQAVGLAQGASTQVTEVERDFAKRVDVLRADVVKDQAALAERVKTELGDLSKKTDAIQAATQNRTSLLTQTALVDLGYDIKDRQADAGKIGYQRFSKDALDLVGAGTADKNRKVRVWDELHTEAVHVKSAFASVIDLGQGQADRQKDAGKVVYRAFSDGLDIVGAGKTGESRRVRVWDQVETDRVRLNRELCIGTTCIDKAALDRLLGSSPPPFRLAHPDGRVVRWSTTDNGARLNAGTEMLMETTSPAGLPPGGWTALQTSPGRTHALRHRNFVAFWEPFVVNNGDFAWRLTPQADGTFVIDAMYGNGLYALGYDAPTDAVRVVLKTDAARMVRWRMRTL